MLQTIQLAGNQALREPSGVAVDGAGDVYVADTGNGRLGEYAPTGELLAEWGTGRLVEPFALVVDADGHVFVLDSDRAVVERLGPDGTHEATLLAEAGMYHPRGVTLDASGRLNVTDTGRSRVVQASSTGAVLQSWTRAGVDPLAEPTDVAV